MLEAMHTYIQKIVLFGILTAISYQILPGEKYEKYLKLYTGFLFILVLFFPMIQISGIEKTFQQFYSSYEMKLQYDGEEKQVKNQLYAKYEESMAKQLKQVLEREGHSVDSVQIKADSEQSGKLEEVIVILKSEEARGEIVVPVIEIQGQQDEVEEKANEKEVQKQQEVEQLLKTMWSEEDGISIVVQHKK